MRCHLKIKKTYLLELKEAVDDQIKVSDSWQPELDQFQSEFQVDFKIQENLKFFTK